MNYFHPYYYNTPMPYGYGNPQDMQYQHYRNANMNPHDMQYWNYPHMNPWMPNDMNSNYWFPEMNPDVYGKESSSFKHTGHIIDRGPAPYTVDIEEAAKKNRTYRTALWTGPHLQVTLMSLHPGEDIGLEIHPHTDQFLRIEQGEGIVEMGRSRNHLNYRRKVNEDTAIMVPAGTWHNVINTGKVPLKLYSIYAPPHHPHGTVHRTKADAMAGENHHY
ncbi:MAG: cupin domain-containing protein [Bacilli bacterium]|uniref:Cupin domain-containing protein n=1 Tax=Ureibacillus suwonensis TaxID=313007 RepID=A0ABW0RB55_9BACL|nr:cupin domain-containing protein [Bacilli bacterium]